MDTPLFPPNPPLIMLGGHMSQHETELIIRCHDRIFRKVSASDHSGQALFRVEGARFGTSWSWRRKVFDSVTDKHLFDVRHENFDIKNKWVVETPDALQLCSLVHKAQLTSNHSSINVTVRTEAGEQVLVVMRQVDRSALTVIISIGDTTIATIQKTEDNDITFLGNKDRSVWKARVAAGVDLKLIMAIALCRAEMGHLWRQ
ncbi:hypothetical protein F4677DRAFT_45302 [Hypoxylon crocopeplum]|nr:hypothetical protein F4677DRAFT_45302 [Hypoxylon crocopeplum]